LKNQKLVLAIACALATGGAMAQTSVQLYGIVDAGVEYLTNAATVGGSSENLFRMSTGNQSGSRFGLRGTEDLGGGLQAVMVLENGFDVDTGNMGQGGRLFGRQAYVGLQSGAGAVTLGRQQNSIYDLIIKYDPFSFSSRYSAGMHDSILSGRADNAVKYTGTFGPLTATAFYSFGRNADGEAAGESKVSRNIGGGVAYTAGPLGAGIAVDQYQGNTVATKDQSARRVALGASYTMGPVKGFVGYRHLKDEIVAAGTPDLKSNLYWVGASYQLAPALVLSGSYYHTARKDSSQDPSSLVLAADYSLSKRTDVYVTVANAHNKAGSNLGLNGFGTSIVAGENQTGVVAGVRHRF
jgi:predicted porin